jgi:hypothetical protein
VVTHFSITGPANSTAGSALSFTVTALDGANNPVASYRGTVHFTTSDPSGTVPVDYTFTSTDNGAHTFTSGATLRTAGSQTITATDPSGPSGSFTLVVNPGAATHLVFGQQPTNAGVGAVISPAVTVRVLDQFNNLVTNDNTDQVTLTLGANPGGGTLSGSNPVTVSGGVATFSNLSINQTGNGYTLVASSGSYVGVTSGSFNVTTTTSNVIEGFETSDSWYIVGAANPTAYVSTVAAHDGTYGLVDTNGNDWIYRNDAGAQVRAGDTVSVWVQLAGSADGRAYFGFGASAGGTLSLVLAPNTGQLLIMNNVNYGYQTLAAVKQNYLANHWYRMEVDWGASGRITGKLFDSNGVTLLQTITATTTAINSGGIAFRALGSNKYWDTVTATYGVNPGVAGNHDLSAASAFAQALARTGSENPAQSDFPVAAPASQPVSANLGTDANPASSAKESVPANTASIASDSSLGQPKSNDFHRSAGKASSLIPADGWWEPFF